MTEYKLMAANFELILENELVKNKNKNKPIIF